ncbi:MraY family glycosyltransferase [Paraburkholderia metrosideri]|uniref:Undecaprenyl-phosphate alpha-N-acetylglucosaminyl 1-phosphate transferase n=1 Tax=Paraburkholderia metrosideri TaxID=580937 RepID=A0ABN7HKU9_9BURK|nr:glycosyltransferase [Paraburkholderia metrosideri]CAD6524774.1 Undecaprenyl-phosphate alpha-N-acetylglucosaminyl 1-phosphate transferase [Paraburkholderia metrosideri]
MLDFAVGFIGSFLVLYIIVHSASMHGSLSMDHDLHGIQKNHAYAVPRIGGIGIACAAVVTSVAQPIWSTGSNAPNLILLLCAVPAFTSGVAEDLTKRVSPRVRLLCALASAFAACITLQAVLTRIDLPYLDKWMRFTPFAVAFTVFGVSGFTNAINIIDGFNGLASVVAMLIFASIGYVAQDVGDHLVLSVALTMLGAISGFVPWNFPAPSVFLGDGGAYLTGFIAAELMVLLVVRHPGVSAWYPIAVSIYPTFETLFSIYRRKVIRGRPAGAPDGLHLHTLIYRRVVRKNPDSRNLRQCTRRNSMTSVYLWALSLISIVPSTFFSSSPVVLAGVIVTFVIIYLWFYSSIVTFRIPNWIMPVRTTSVVVEHPRH